MPWAAPEGITFDKDYIYFRDIDISTVGILNRITKKIDWHTRINDLEPRPMIIINDIQITENQIYVLDTGGTLNIFERELI
jgi:hypothetical protein